MSRFKYSSSANFSRLNFYQQGFSYLWVLMLIAFMGLSLVLVVEVDSTASQREKEKELLAIGHQFREAIGRYYGDQITGRYYGDQMTVGKHEYPASLEDLLQDQRLPGIKRHLRKIFVDPMTGKAEWGVVKIAGRIVGVHSLSERMPIKKDGFEPEDVSLRGKQKFTDWVFTYPAGLVGNVDGNAANKPQLQGSDKILLSK